MRTKGFWTYSFLSLISILIFCSAQQNGLANGTSGGFTKGDWYNPHAMISSESASYDQINIEAFDAGIAQPIQEAATRIELVNPLNQSMHVIIKAYARGCLGEGTAGFMSAEDYCDVLPRFLSGKPGILLDLEEDSETGTLKFLVFDEQSQDVVIKVLPN